MAKATSKSSKLKKEAMEETTSSDRLVELAQEGTPIARFVAANSASPPSLLRELAQSSSAAIKAAVAANPNTPTDVLLSLAVKYPKEFLSNPILDMLLLENPDFVQDIPEDALQKLLVEEQVNEFFLDCASKHKSWEVALMVATHPRTTKATLEKLLAHRGRDVKEAVKFHVNFAGEMTSGYQEAARSAMLSTSLSHAANEKDLAIVGAVPEYLFPVLECKSLFEIAILPDTPTHILEVLGSNRCLSVRQGVASNPNTPSHVLEALVAEGNRYINDWLAENPNAPGTILSALALDRWREPWIAKNPNTPMFVLSQLSEHPDWQIRYHVASNPSTSEEILSKLIDDEHKHVCQAVASNPKTSHDLLERLLNQNHYIRASVASNPKTPLYLLLILVKDPHSQVRSHVADNPNIPFRLLQMLAKDTDERVRASVASNPKTPLQFLEFLMKDKTIYVRCSVASNPNTPVNFIETLFQNKNAEHIEIRRRLAANPNTPVSILKELALDTSFYIHLNLAINPNTPDSLINVESLISSNTEFLAYETTHPEILATLAKHDSITVRTLVASNQYTSESTLSTLVQDKSRNVFLAVSKNPNISKIKLLQLTLQKATRAHNSSFSRLIALLHPLTPTSALVKYCHSLVWLERYAIAQNPNTPENILQHLALDANRIVRAAARSQMVTQNQC